MLSSSSEPPTSHPPRRLLLLVDDDARMRALERRILEKAGYRIAEAGDADEALGLLAQGVWPDLVIADLEMPSLPGHEMVRRIRRVHPEQRVLFVTGNVDRLLTGEPGTGEAAPVLDKPFTSKGLLDAVAQLLHARGPASRTTKTADELRSTASRVLVVDDMATNVALIRRVLSDDEFEIEAASDAEAALEAVLARPPDVIILDVRMPGRDGFELCTQLKSDDATRLIPVVLVTGNTAAEDRLRAIRAGADDFVAKPLNPTELRARVRALARVKRYTDELDTAEQVIVSLALTIEARDATTNGHCQRLAVYGTAMGEALQLDREELRALRRGGYLHDLGKIAIPDSVLSKPGPLTPDELRIMRMHPIVGERLCGDLRSLASVRPILRHHHERLDGSGYPDGLGGSQIPKLAEIIGLVDVYDALTTTRPYRAAMPFDEAARALRDEVARGWRRKELVDLLLDLAASGRLDAPHTTPV